MIYRRQTHWPLFCLAALLALAGCGDNRGLVPVKGKITFDGAHPPKNGQITFGPLEAAGGFPQRPGVAPFDAEGKFTATSYQPGDGLTPGKYRVSVYCVERDPEPKPGGLEAVTYVDPKYNGQDLLVEVGSSPIELSVEVPLKRRK
jgi:hypothetical protein